MGQRDLTTTTKQVFGDVKKGTKCRVCGRNVTDGRSKHCSDYCQTIVRTVMCLLNWSSVRRLVIDRDNETCQNCGFKREWIMKGQTHIRDRVMELMPERPPAVSLSELGEWDDDPERRAYWKERQAYDKLHNDLLDKYNIRNERSNNYKTQLEVDHITPIADGGHPFDPDNLITLCNTCHQEKTSEENSERFSQDKYEDRPEIDIREYITGSVGD